MKFSNFLSLFAAIISSVVGVQAWVSKIVYPPIWGIVPTWQIVSLLMFIFYWINISILAKDLQEYPFERITEVFVQHALRDSIHEMLIDNSDLKDLLGKATKTAKMGTK